MEEGDPGSGQRLMLLLVFDVLILVFLEPPVAAAADTVEAPPVLFF